MSPAPKPRLPDLAHDATIVSIVTLLAQLVDERVDRALAGRAADEWIAPRESRIGRAGTMRLVAAGKVAARRVGRRIFVRKADVDAAIESMPALAVPPAPVPAPEEQADESVEASRIRVAAERAARRACR